MSENTNAGGGEPVTILYTNWRGKTAVRRIVPQPVPGAAAFWFGATSFHTEPQWLVLARDADKGEDRDFALSGIKAWGQEAVDAALSAQSTGSAGVAAEPVAWALELADAFERSGKTLFFPEQFPVGYPAGWDAAHRECAKDLRHAAKYPPVTAAPTPPTGGGETHKIIEAADCIGVRGATWALTIEWPDGAETIEHVSDHGALALGYSTSDDEPSPDQNRGEPDQGGEAR